MLPLGFLQAEQCRIRLVVLIFLFWQGLSSLGRPSLTYGQFSALCSRYADPKHGGNILWKKFISDIEQGVYTSHNVCFTLPYIIVPTDEVPMLRPGAVDFPTTVGESYAHITKLSFTTTTKWCVCDIVCVRRRE